jgi:iron complex outermembrane receptor protein
MGMRQVVAMETLVRVLTGAGFYMLSICALAQVNPDSDPAEDAQAKVLAPITVTGYHIKRIDTEGPAPLLVFEREDFERAGINTLEEFARYLPINLPEEIRQYGAIGATGFDLRGIGIDTTLTLVNGYRIAPFAQLAENAVDINSIPVSAIERIEILKDGASAIYGADAIAGVVNIILRENFNGMEASAGYGVSQEGDGREILADFIAGRDSGRGNILFSLSWYDREPQAMSDRDWSDSTDYSSIGGPDWGAVLGSPPTLYRYDTELFEADPECGTDPSVSSVGDSPNGPRYGTACKYNYPSSTELLWGIERVGLSLSGRYEIKPNLSFFGDLLYSEVEGETHRAPSPIGGSSVIETWYHLPFVSANHPDNPFGTDGELLTRPLDTGNRIHINNSRAYRTILGVEGIWGAWDWRFSGLASKNRVEKEFQNMVSNTGFQLALLGLGGPNENLWYNPFGYEPHNDQPIIDWLRTTARLKDTSGEYSADLLFNRLFGSLPGGQVGVAIGFQYREQELEQWADEQLMSGDLVPRHDPVSADRDITSAFVEFNLPLLDSLEAQLALRYENYSDFGSTTNPKLALRWQPLFSLMFRVSYSTSFKPPSFYELYAPPAQDWQWYFDTVRCEYIDSPDDCWIQAPLVDSGNQDLDAEKGKSWFAGMVWEPGFLPGLELQLDFWKFSHEDRIEWLRGQWVLDRGGDFGIFREPTEPDGTPGRIILVKETFVNTDELLTEGFDTTLRYSWQTDNMGDFRASLMHTYIDKWVITDSVHLNIQGKNFAGTYGWTTALPRNRANVNFSWDRWPHGAAANIHYIGHYENSSNLWVDGVETEKPMIIPDHTTLDLQYSYNFEKLRNATLRLGCNNVADEDPPLTYDPINQPFHDARGRFFYIRWQQPIW